MAIRSASFEPYWGFNAQSGRQREALDAILDGIATGRFPVDERLSEALVAKTLRMSRTPVREALSALAMRGFVRRIPQVGFLVLPVTLSELIETIEPRQRLEGVVVEVLASRESGGWEWLRFEPGIDHAREAVARMASLLDTTLDAGGLEFQRLDTRFHYALACAAGMPEVAQQIQVWRDKQRIFAAALGRPYPIPAEMAAAVEEHNTILAAIDAGAVQTATDAVRTHLTGAFDRLRLASDDHPNSEWRPARQAEDHPPSY